MDTIIRRFRTLLNFSRTQGERPSRRDDNSRGKVQDVRGDSSASGRSRGCVRPQADVACAACRPIHGWGVSIHGGSTKRRTSTRFFFNTYPHAPASCAAVRKQTSSYCLTITIRAAGKAWAGTNRARPPTRCRPRASRRFDADPLHRSDRRQSSIPATSWPGRRPWCAPRRGRQGIGATEGTHRAKGRSAEAQLISI
jgi:hypothetical protein